MDNWNPLHDDFVDPNFNSYNKGPGSSLPRKGLAGDGVQLYVGGIPLTLSKEALCNLFSQAGKVKDVKILPTKNPGSLETFGFVTMSNLKEATDAITMLDRFRIDRFFLKVRPYKSKEDRQKWKKKKEEEEAFLLSLNQSKQHSQSGVLSTSDSDESFHKSKPTSNGVKKGDTRPKNSGRGRGLLKDDLSLTDLDNTNIPKTPSTDSASSINSLADLTITVDQQLRQVRKGDTTSECNYSSNNSRSRGRGVTALQQNQNMIRGSNNQDDQSFTRKSLGLRGQIPVTPSGKPCLYCRKKACLLCKRCKMPYCSIDCQKADWPKHRISCSKISTMPKEINLDPDEFEVSVGEDIVEYLPSDSRILVKDCEEKLIASYQNEKREYESVNNNSPVKQSSLLNSNIARPKGEKTYGRNVPTLTQDLKPDQDLKIFIVLATSPEDFIVQIDEPTSKATLEALTNELYKVHEKQDQTLYMPEVGELVSCKYEDGQWYRGSVQQVTNASAIIYFLDFGNVSEIPLMRIRPGLSEHSDYPGQAIRCCLKNVKPLRMVNSIKIDDTFSETCLQNGCRFKAKIDDITSNLVTLDLYDGKGNSMLDKLTVAVGKEPVSNTIPTLEISNHDRDISCVFTGFVSDTEFCVYEFESQEKLVELHQDLTKHCSGVATGIAPSVGDYVCALFEGAWYRAQVKSVQERCVSVYFVDYGNSSDVLIKNIRSTLPEHMKLPCQAIRCSFDGVDEPLDHETKNQMTSILQNNPVNIKFVSTSNGVCKVQVILDGSNVNECLKQILNTETDTSMSKSTENSSEDVKIPPAEIPADGEEIACVFVGFVSDTEFCVTKLETLKQLIELSDTLTKHCTSTTERGAPSVGDYVCALYEGSWYRAQVKGVKGEMLTVYYVDYGNSSDISVDCIRTILPEHLEFSSQAIRCSFDGVEKPLDQQTKNQITTILQNCPINIKFISSLNGICKVQAMADGNNINDCLKEVLNPETDVPVSESSEHLPKDLKIPPPEIPSDGQETNCIFTGFVSDTDFCVSKLEALNELIELGEKLTRHCEDTYKASMPSAGDYVCALFEGDWYRALVKGVQGDLISVYYLDYGNKSEISVDHVRTMLPEHLKLPCQAIRCSFDGVDEPLDHETKNQMTSILQNSPINIKFVSTSNGVCKVQVILDGSNVNECLKQILNTETDTSVSKSTENIKIPPAEIPADGEEIACVFVGFVSDTEFCVTKLETLKQLIELSDTLTNHCTSTTERGAPSVGDYVCALYEGGWYRAQVKGVKGEMLTVYFVDYGNSEDVHQNDTRAMLSEYFKLPCQAIKCSINGLEHSLNDHQKKDITAILEKNYFTVRYVTKKQDSCEVEIPSINEFIDTTSTDLFEEKPIPEQDYPTDGSHFGAIVTSCISDNMFCVLIKDQILGLSKLMEQISVFCSEESESYAAKVGDYVCALYNTDGYWYRAKIVNIHKSGYQVYFVDYGNTDDVDKSNIRKLVTDLRTFPTQAIVCRLFGVKSVEKEFFGKLMTTHVQIEVAEQVEGINFVKVWLEDGSCVNDLFAKDQSEVLPCIRELPLPSSDMALTKDKAVEFEIQYIDTLSSFYIQVLHPNCKEVLEKIEQEILECCQAVIPYCPTVGEYVCCLYEGLWYRAYVNHVEEDVYRVNLIDYGNEIEVDSGAIRKFTAKLASFPPLAFQCCLNRISPDSRSLEKFAEVLTSDQNTKMKLIRKENGVNIVEIILSSGQCLSDLLCPNNPHDANISDPPSTTVKAMERHTVDDLQFIVPSDSELTVIFTYVKDPFNIYCHSATEQGAEAMMKIQEMCLKVMAPYCEKSDKNIEPRVNEVYCGKYVDDWYRCVVLELCKEKKILVRFLDMGEEKEILVCDLRPILPEFLALPVSVFLCSLNGVKMFGDRWGTGASDLIRSICNETCKLNVVKRDNELLICDVISCRGVNVSQELIKQCLAEEAVESIDNSPDGEDDEEEEEILRKIAELQAKLTKKGKTVKS